MTAVPTTASRDGGRKPSPCGSRGAGASSVSFCRTRSATWIARCASTASTPVRTTTSRWSRACLVLELIETRRRSGIGRLAQRPDIAALAIVFTFAALVNAFAMTGPAFALEHWLADTLQLSSEAIALGIVFVIALIGIPAALLVPAAAVTRVMTGAAAMPLGSTLRSYAYALIPFGFGVWLAHYGFHLFTGILTVVPVTQSAIIDLFGSPLLGEPAWRWVGMAPGSVYQSSSDSSCWAYVDRSASSRRHRSVIIQPARLRRRFPGTRRSWSWRRSCCGFSSSRWRCAGWAVLDDESGPDRHVCRHSRAVDSDRAGARWSAIPDPLRSHHRSLSDLDLDRPRYNGRRRCRRPVLGAGSSGGRGGSGATGHTRDGDDRADAESRARATRFGGTSQGRCLEPVRRARHGSRRPVCRPGRPSMVRWERRRSPPPRTRPTMCVHRGPSSRCISRRSCWWACCGAD